MGPNQNASSDTDIWKQKYSFHWDVLDVVISGKSIIDIKGGVGAHLVTHEDADRFCQTYGFDLSDPIQQAEAQGHFHEAVAFIRRFFLQPENPEGLRLEIPKKILEIADMRELLLLSNRSQSDLRDWACAILKVMHSIAHIDKDVRTFYFSNVQKQILDRFYRVIHRDAQGSLYIGKNTDDPLRVDLVHFESKPKKSRESVLLKLLHKPENVADEIFDRVGLRFVTHDTLDVLRLIKYLKNHQIIMSANTKPSRARNSMVDVDHFRKSELEIFARLEENGAQSEEALRAELVQAIRPPAHVLDNPHSANSYRAIQFTCRQLIRIDSPLHDQLKVLKTLAKRHQERAEPDLELLAAIEKTDLKVLPRVLSFFYPFEVQITDQSGYEESLKGQSSHTEYKRSQIQTAMKRVLSVFMTGSA